MKKIAFLAIALPMLALVGCQTMPYVPYAREVKRMPGNGGEIALKTGHVDADREKAQTMMASNCGHSTVKVLEEGEVVVGQTTNSNATQTNNAGSSGSKVGTFLGMPIVSGAHGASNDTATSATTTALKEWNIKYECGKVASADASTTEVKVKKAKK